MAKQTNMPSGNKDTSFIRETIRPKKKKWWRSVLKWMLLAILCGCAAGATFWLLIRFVPEAGKPNAEESLPVETQSEEEKPSADEPDDNAVDAERAWQELKRELEQKVVAEIDRHYVEGDSLSGLVQEIEGTYKEVQNASLAVVINTQQSVDWLQNPREQRKEAWALILSIEEDRVLLLANSRDLESAAALSVRFGERLIDQVTILAQDSLTHMAVLQADLAGESLTENWQAAEFESSYNLQNGSWVLALGAPLGNVESLDYGIISWQYLYQNTVDSNYTVYYTNMKRINDSGVLVNLQGQVVGWVTDLHEEGTDSVTAAIGISQLTALLERLQEGKAPVLLGIIGEEVPELVQEAEQVPAGVYVTGIQDGSPALEAGLQYGDIVTKFDDIPVVTMNGLQKALLQAESGQAVTLTVMRWGREGYSEISIPVVLGTR